MEEPAVKIDASNWFGHETFAHEGSVYQVSDVEVIIDLSAKHSLNYIPSYLGDLTLCLVGGKCLRYRGQSTFEKTRHVSAIGEALGYMQERTWQQRLIPYIRDLQSQGWVQYRDHRIYANGDITLRNKTVNIADAAIGGEVWFGVRSEGLRSSGYDPNLVYIHHKERGPHYKESMRVRLYENADVLLALLRQLAQSKGGENIA